MQRGRLEQGTNTFAQVLHCAPARSTLCPRARELRESERCAALSLPTFVDMAADAQDPQVQAYSALLEQLNDAPYDRSLHEQRIALARNLALADEVDQARNGLAQVFPLSQGAS